MQKDREEMMVPKGKKVGTGQEWRKSTHWFSSYVLSEHYVPGLQGWGVLWERQVFVAQCVNCAMREWCPESRGNWDTQGGQKGPRWCPSVMPLLPLPGPWELARLSLERLCIPGRKGNTKSKHRLKTVKCTQGRWKQFSSPPPWETSELLSNL